MYVYMYYDMYYVHALQCIHNVYILPMDDPRSVRWSGPTRLVVALNFFHVSHLMLSSCNYTILVPELKLTLK